MCSWTDGYDIVLCNSACAKNGDGYYASSDTGGYET